jgi:riboflavin kinase / FMN adenylyltransferase
MPDVTMPSFLHKATSPASKQVHICTEDTPFVPAVCQQTGVVYALGVFDGIHQGHQAVLHKALKRAEQRACHAGVFSFSTHPKQRLEHPDAIRLLLSPEHKIQTLAQYGFDVILMPPFTEALREMEPLAFVKDLLIEQLGACELVVGYDFHFGYQRKGNADWLQQHANALGIQVHVVDALLLNTAEPDAVALPVSSTRIRQCLHDGDVAVARQLLGRAYRLSGKTVAGKQLGRTIGVPTLNVSLSEVDCIIPSYGVYIAEVFTAGQTWPCVLNVGTAPTLTPLEIQVTLEAHVLGTFPHEDWVEQPIEVAFFKRIRSEQRFEDLNSLKAQIEQDIEVANAWWEEANTKAKTQAQTCDTIAGL